VPKKFQSILDAILNQHPGIHDPVALIRAGRVFADGTPVTNPASRVAADATITVRPPRTLRGTLKLQAALAVFDCTITGRAVLDIGASTGGFTVALLEARARHVYALDAGHGQLLGSLRQDPRVTNLERTNLAALGADLIPESVEVVTIDLSYLAIADAIPQLGALTLARDAELIALVKPMFELHLARPPRDPKQRAGAVDRAAAALTVHDWRVVDSLESPIRGRSGAIEFFVHAVRRIPRAPALPHL
jgi:23S rRNA (cytidine1920-2'-O)/16S rRNA (cytidine1409-2'-O)-methyltransferase